MISRESPVILRLTPAAPASSSVHTRLISSNRHRCMIISDKISECKTMSWIFASSRLGGEFLTMFRIDDELIRGTSSCSGFGYESYRRRRASLLMTHRGGI
jgi:hypothetical protein